LLGVSRPLDMGEKDRDPINGDQEKMFGIMPVGRGFGSTTFAN
jgi:hypothetical protein